MRIRYFWSAISVLSLIGNQTFADAFPCAEIGVSVDAADQAQQLDFCKAAKRAIDKLAACNVRINQHITIRVTEDLAENCLGLFHCGEQLIEVLPVDRVIERRHPESVFSHLSATEFRDSILVHELAHAAYDDVACPYSNCRATAEYLAYAMQIMSLPADQRRKIEAGLDFEKKVSREEFSAVMLAFAPRIFIRKSWAHLTQRGHKCAYIGQIMDGTIVFDIEGL